MSLSDHTESSSDDHNVAKRIIARELSSRRGKDNAISSNDLAGKTPVSSSTVRDLVAEVRTDFHLPIVASAQGYYLIDSQETFLQVMDKIEDEIETRKQTQRELAQVWNSRVVE